MTRPSGITPEQIALAKSWWHDESLGMTAEAIGDRFGVSKSTILGLAHRGKWASRRRELKPYAKRTALTIVNGGPSTLFTRMAALDAIMDRCLAENTAR